MSKKKKLICKQICTIKTNIVQIVKIMVVNLEISQ